MCKRFENAIIPLGWTALILMFFLEAGLILAHNDGMALLNGGVYTAVTVTMWLLYRRYNYSAIKLGWLTLVQATFIAMTLLARDDRVDVGLGASFGVVCLFGWMELFCAIDHKNYRNAVRSSK